MPAKRALVGGEKGLCPLWGDGVYRPPGCNSRGFVSRRSVQYLADEAGHFFGGEGFILERLSGEGIAFVHACGDFVEFDLQAGQTMKVDTGCVVGWDGTVDFDIERVKGIKTMFFGGEGLFLTTLKGPGKIIIQSMTLANLATALAPFLPSTRAPSETSGSSGVLGTILEETIGRR